MFEILPRDWNLEPIFTQKWVSVDMNWGPNPRKFQPCWITNWQFLPARRYASAGNSDRNVSVRRARAGIVSKRTKLAAWFLHPLVAPRL